VNCRCYSQNMGDEEEYKVVYTDGDEEEELKWIARAGKALVTYSNGCTYEGQPLRPYLVMLC